MMREKVRGERVYNGEEVGERMENRVKGERRKHGMREKLIHMRETQKEKVVGERKLERKQGNR